MMTIVIITFFWISLKINKIEKKTYLGREKKPDHFSVRDDSLYINAFLRRFPVYMPTFGNFINLFITPLQPVTK